MQIKNPSKYLLIFGYKYCIEYNHKNRHFSCDDKWD